MAKSSKFFTTTDGLARDTVKDIFEDETGTLWFATSSGVSQYDGEKFNNIIVNGTYGDGCITRLVESNHGNCPRYSRKFLVWQHR